uniref:Replication protein n=1 Tax=uncultured prokaryote TaxID=198431 RepID=A0A0H5QH55_9ZZZZ|nr:hypothetical protein [uncultured prokaryote]
MSKKILTDTSGFDAAVCGVSALAPAPSSEGGTMFRNIQVESTPSKLENARNYRRLEWKKLQKMQAIFPEISSQIRKMGRADYLADDKKKDRYKKAASHSLRKCGCQVVPSERKNRKTGEMIQTKAPGTAQVKIFPGGGMGWTWLVRCASVWFCPVCAPKIMSRRRHELEKGIKIFKKHKFYFAFVTLTIPHSYGVPLVEYMEKLQAVLKRFRSGKSWTNLKKRIGMRGYIRAQEVTCGKKTGWHPHFHELLVLEKKLTKAEQVELTDFLKRRWVRLCAEEGITSARQEADHLRYGVDVRCGSDPISQDYLAKTVSWELSSLTTKAAREDERFQPLALASMLTDAEATEKEKKWAAHLWSEYMIGMYGRVAVYWSPGLKRFCGIPELSDAELIEGEAESGPIIEADAAGFRRIAWKRLQVPLLELCEKVKLLRTEQIGAAIGADIQICEAGFDYIKEKHGDKS